MKPKKKIFRVYIAQVNQTYVDVSALDSEEACEKGYRKWRRSEGHSSVIDIEESPKTPHFATIR